MVEVALCGLLSPTTLAEHKLTYYSLFYKSSHSTYLPETNNALTFQVLILLIITCYGGGFACMPAYLADLYGIRQLSTIHGRILTAWGLAGIVGPMLVSYFHEAGYGYTYSFSMLCSSICIKYNYCYNLKNIRQTRVCIKDTVKSPELITKRKRFLLVT